ncbi:PfkB family carbohydrate kinase [Rhizobium laguerreae]|nr:PfkB family carbohydrate kinase [Rhizobium laguerreae]
MRQPVLISIGSINADLEFRDVSPLGKGGTVRAGSFTQSSGGKAANVALFSHRLDVPTWLIGCVGRDHYADIALETLRAEGMDLSAISIAENAPTGIAVVAVPKGGEKTMLNASNANMAWDEKATDLVQHKIATAPDGSILVADFEIPGNVLDAAFAGAERRALRIFVDPTFPEEIELSQLKRFDTITPNQGEANALLNREIKTDEEAIAAATQLSGNGVNAVCLKLSNGGCVLCENCIAHCGSRCRYGRQDRSGRCIYGRSRRRSAWRPLASGGRSPWCCGRLFFCRQKRRSGVLSITRGILLLSCSLSRSNLKEISLS